MIQTDDFKKLREDLSKKIETNWKIEAKSEDVGRYFYHMNEVEAILSGSKNYVIGRKGTSTSKQDTEERGGKNSILVEAGRIAALTRKNATYTLDGHFEKLDSNIIEIFNAVRDFIVAFDSSIEETPKKIILPIRPAKILLVYKHIRKN